MQGYQRTGKAWPHKTAELTAAGCVKVFAEKVSGAKTDRVELARVLKRIEAGDLLIVTRLDRSARSTRDLLNILHALAERGAKFKSQTGVLSCPALGAALYAAYVGDETQGGS